MSRLSEKEGICIILINNGKAGMATQAFQDPPGGVKARKCERIPTEKGASKLFLIREGEEERYTKYLGQWAGKTFLSQQVG